MYRNIVRERYKTRRKSVKKIRVEEFGEKQKERAVNRRTIKSRSKKAGEMDSKVFNRQ